jgi:hypothetical protein
MHPIALARACMRSLIAGIRTHTHVDRFYIRVLRILVSSLVFFLSIAALVLGFVRSFLYSILYSYRYNILI